MDDIEQNILGYIESELLPGSATLELSPSDNLFAEGIIDSVGLQSVIGHIESRFQIQVEEEELTPENFATVWAIGSLVKSLKK